MGCGSPPACRHGQQLAPRAQSLAADAQSLAAGAGHYLHLAHAHNDYVHDRPLSEALDAGFCSVEADIWQQGGRITVSHLGWSSRGTLEELYLDPLQARVDRQGSVCAAAVPFTLWLDIKENDAALQPVLRKLLAAYPMLETIPARESHPAPVRVVLTGNEALKTRFVSEVSPCPAWRDSNDFDPHDPPGDRAWRFYALDWTRYVGWNGEGTIAAGQRARLACIVHGAHAAGRAVRFYDTPETEGYWRLAVEQGVDFIGTDDIGALAAFLGDLTP